MIDPASEIRAVVEERIAAVKAKDARPLAERMEESIVAFDVLPPLNARGKSAVTGRAEEWFDGYASEIGYDVEQLEIEVDGDVGFCSFLYHVSGTLKSDDEVSMWVRATMGLRRIDGEWRIVHGHESVPWDPESGRGMIDLPPQG